MEVFRNLFHEERRRTEVYDLFPCVLGRTPNREEEKEKGKA